MQARKIAAFVGIMLTTQFALADASYQTTYQITGGSFVDALKGQAFIGKQVDKMFAPTNRIVMVHGNQKAEISKESTEIIDLDKGEIIRIDHVKKTYTIVTFEQMRKLMATMPQQMQQMQKAQAQQPQPQMPATNIQMTFATDVKNTGVTKVVNGLTAQEQVITVKMIMTDPNPQPGQPNSITYNVITDAWIAPDPPEIKEIHDFDMRMAEKMMAGVDLQAWAAQMKANSSGGGGMAMMFGGHPGSQQAMDQMAKEMAKIKGTRILEVMSMGGDAPAQPGGAAPAAAPAQQQQGSVAGQVATDTATQTASSESSKLGTFGSALSNSALSAFHRKKSTPPPAQPAAAPATPGATPGTQHVTMMETTNSMTNFSEEPVPASAFQIPAGYKQVQSPMGAQ
jgi:hypothetical protein